MLFLKLAEAFNQLEQISSRIALRDTLAALYKSLSPKEAAITSYFIVGRLAPKFINAEFNISKKTIEKIIQELFSIDRREVRELLLKYNDYGGIFANLSKNSNTTSLQIEDLYERLWDIALISGAGSQIQKFEKLYKLLASASAAEGKYIIRIILGRTRLGVSERTIIEALAYTRDPKDKKAIEKSLGYTSDVGYVAFLYVSAGLEGLKKAVFTPGVPIAPKLVEREVSIEKIFKRIPNPYEEPKYDGLRCQVHIFKAGDSKGLSDRVWSKFVQNQAFSVEGSQQGLVVKLFSRNLEDMTAMFPEIKEGYLAVGEELFKKYPEARAFVFDGEIVGYNENTGEFLPFQETMTRKRKYNVEEAAAQTPVKIFTFDVLFFIDSPLLDFKLEQRKEKLADIKDIHEDILLTPLHKPKDAKEAEKLFLEYVAEGLEGVIFKDPQTLYTPGLRNFDWIKFKRAMKHELADTIDVVVVGYYYGTGRLAKLGIGALLGAVYDKENDRYVTITKIGTGITEDQWKMLKNLADQYKIDRQLPNVEIPKELRPDVFLEPGLVIEIEADEITKSPVHTAGYALRFPRFKRVRDKAPTDATSLQEILEMVKEKASAGN